MKAHVFNLDNLLINIEQKVWIIDKSNPKIPLIKISKEDFNLIKSGVYKKDNISFNFDGKFYWINKSLFDKLTKQVKNLASSERLTFSFREFTDPQTIKDMNISYDISIMNGIKDTNDDIFFITTKGTEKKYGHHYNKLIDLLKEDGVLVNKVFYLNQSYFSQNKDENIKKLSFILINLLTGYNIEENKFGEYTDREYTEICYYDSNSSIIDKMGHQFNQFLTFVANNTDPYVDVDVKNKKLFLNKVGSNKLNPYVSSEIKLHISKLIKTYEQFKNLF